VDNKLLNDFKVPSVGRFGDYHVSFSLWIFLFSVFSFLPKGPTQWAYIGAIAAYSTFLILTIFLLVATISLKVKEYVQFFLLIGGLVVSFLVSKYGGEFIPVQALKSPALLITSVSVAILLVRRIEKSWHIAIAGVVGLIADLWSVFSSSGLTKHLVEEAPQFLNYLLLGFPFPGGQVRPMIGAADYVFLAIFVLHCHKFELDATKNLKWLSFSLVVTVVLANFLGMGLPAIPLMALFFVVLNRKRLWGDFVTDFRKGFK